jgi:hypothetical protein
LDGDGEIEKLAGEKFAAAAGVFWNLHDDFLCKPQYGFGRRK